MLNVLTKKLSYIFATLFLSTSLAVYVLFDGISSVLSYPVHVIALGLLLAAPLILALALGRMYATSRLPKDVSWLWIVFFVSWAFLCSNIVVLASRQSTMQYGAVATMFDYLGAPYAAVTAAARLEFVVVQLVAVVSIILLFVILPYAYWDKRRKLTSSPQPFTIN